MDGLDKNQTDYLVKVLISCAEQLVAAIQKDPTLLQSLIEEQVINDGTLKAFVQTLAALPARMTELLKQGKYSINDTLDGLRGAQANIDSGKALAVIEVRSKPLVPTELDLVLTRVRTLLHEVSHTIEVAKTFPILDYSYATGWGFDHLGPLCAANADTFAEAIMLVAENPNLNLAEPPLKGAKWLFRTYNMAVAQRAVMREAQATGLAAALAWIDLRVNRAWLRMADYHKFAGCADDGTSAFVEQDRRIEEQFRTWGIVGQRQAQSFFTRTKMLDQASIAAVGNIVAAINQIKDWISMMQVRVVKDGAIAFTKDRPYQLQIPGDLLGSGTATLGNQILDKLFTMLTAEPRLQLPNGIVQVELLDLCINNDRHPEQERLQDRWVALSAIKPVPLKDPDALSGLDALLALAIVDSNAVFWRNIAVKLDIPKRADWLRDAKGMATAMGQDVAKAIEGFKEFETALQTLPQTHPRRADILIRGAKTLDMLKLAVKTIADKGVEVLKADATRAKEWKDFGDKFNNGIAAVDLTK